MRNLSPRRRAAAICGACAAIIPSASLLMHGTHSKPLEFGGGFLVGFAIVMSIAAFSVARRSNCS